MKQNPLGRIKRCVWDIPIQNYRDAHCAVYPTELVKIPILATCPQGGIVLDPFVGSGTTAFVALNNARRFIGIDLNQKYVDLVYKRLLHTKSTTTTCGL